MIRRRLAAELRRIREDRNMRLDEVADELQVSPSTVSRLETTHTVPKVWDVKALASIYGVDSALEARLVEWATALKAGGWWRTVTDSLDEDVEYLISLEAESAEIQAYCQPVVAALFQTEDYARALFKSLSTSGKEAQHIDELVRLRIKRQELLTRSEDPVRLHVIVDESCLRRQVGSPEVMRGQLAHLLERSELRNVTLQLYPLELGFHPAIASSFTIFKPRLDLDPTVVRLEHLHREVFEEGESEIYMRNFDSLSRRALDSVASKKRVNRILAEWDPDPSASPAREEA